MKSKLLIMGVLCAIAFTANAQTEKGKNLIGGSFNYFTANAEQATNTHKQNDFSIGTNYGYFISKNLAIGLKGSYNYSKVVTTSENVVVINGTYIFTTQSNINKQKISVIGPFARYYVDISEKFKFFGQLNANVGFGNNIQTNGSSSKSKTTTYGASLIPSFAIFPTKKIAIELGFGLISYYDSTSKSDPAYFPKSKSNGFSFGFDSFSPTLGVNFHF